MLHKKVDELVASGQITAEEAARFKVDNHTSATKEIGCICATCEKVWPLL